MHTVFTAEPDFEHPKISSNARLLDEFDLDAVAGQDDRWKEPVVTRRREGVRTE